MPQNLTEGPQIGIVCVWPINLYEKEMPPFEIKKEDWEKLINTFYTDKNIIEEEK